MVQGSSDLDHPWALACNIHPINYLWTENIFSFSHWPVHGLANKLADLSILSPEAARATVFCFLRQNIFF